MRKLNALNDLAIFIDTEYVEQPIHIDDLRYFYQDYKNIIIGMINEFTFNKKYMYEITPEIYTALIKNGSSKISINDIKNDAEINFITASMRNLQNLILSVDDFIIDWFYDQFDIEIRNGFNDDDKLYVDISILGCDTSKLYNILFEKFQKECIDKNKGINRFLTDDELKNKFHESNLYDPSLDRLAGECFILNSFNKNTSGIISFNTCLEISQKAKDFLLMHEIGHYIFSLIQLSINRHEIRENIELSKINSLPILIEICMDLNASLSIKKIHSLKENRDILDILIELNNAVISNIKTSFYKENRQETYIDKKIAEIKNLHNIRTFFVEQLLDQF